MLQQLMTWGGLILSDQEEPEFEIHLGVLRVL